MRIDALHGTQLSVSLLTHLASVSEVSGVTVAGAVPLVASGVFWTGAIPLTAGSKMAVGTFLVAGRAGKSRRTQAFAGNVVTGQSGSAPAVGGTAHTEFPDGTSC